jgi:hypothetical protein
MTKRMRGLGTFTALVLAVIGLDGRADASVPPPGLVNGSFESGGPTPEFSISVPGWGAWLGPASSGSDYGIALSSVAPKVAEDGSSYAFFRGTANIQDCLGQGLTTVVGQQYVVSFWMGTDGPTDGHSDQMVIAWGPDFGVSSRDLTFTTFQPTSTTALPYQHYTWTVTGLTTNDILSFHGYDAISSILLDNVTVTPVAPVATPAMGPWLFLLLAAGLAAVGVRAMPRRRQTA